MLDSKKHGRGTLILFDGSVEYYGIFVADKREGMGVQVCGPDKKVAIVGKWKNDKIDGEVLIVDLSDFKNVRKAIYKNDKKVAEGRIERTQPGLFSADETADVGIDLGTPVVEAIGAEATSRFTGRIPKLTLEVR